MWNEEDKMLDLVYSINEGPLHMPTACPRCGKTDAHFLLHRPLDSGDHGTAWIWCSSCRAYSHFSFKIPYWWENPDWIEERKLDSFPDYPESVKRETDAWVNHLLAKRGE
ncbi:MAG: hypothetical protein ACOYIK_05895 [Coriobacteriales bacterium]|jgi:hypothetical protein